MALTLTSLPDDYRCLIVGATGGIGRAFTRIVTNDPRSASVFAASRSGGEVTGATSLELDLTDEPSIKQAVMRAHEEGPLHLVIIATGILHDMDSLQPEKTWRHLDADQMARVLAVNTIGPALVAKHALPALDKENPSILAALSARVGSISDNRLGGWHSYRASKAALNQIIKTCSIELKRKNKSALCVGLHPGTVDTGLSDPFQGNVPDQKLFTPEYSAQCLLGVLDSLKPVDSGGCFDWAGERIKP